MSESNITIAIVNNMVVITHLPPSGRNSNASIIEIPVSEWHKISSNISKMVGGL